MKHRAIKISIGGLFYTRLKKHFCPNCNERLRIKVVSKTVNSRSPEAKDFDFYAVDEYVDGDVKFVWDELQCPSCGFQLPVKEFKQMEEQPSTAKKLILFYVKIAILLLLLILVYKFMSSCSVPKYFPSGDSSVSSTIPIAYTYNKNPFYVKWKKHFCPACGARLTIAYDSVIVNSNSPEAENYNFTFGDTHLKGDVEFRIGYFKCPECEFSIPFDEMYEVEKQQKNDKQK